MSAGEREPQLVVHLRLSKYKTILDRVNSS